jgi:hypothetical protein
MDTVYTADSMITNCTDITGPLISYKTKFLTLYETQYLRIVMRIFVMDTVCTTDCMITICIVITGALISYKITILTVYAVQCSRKLM